jgi:hypothetical protein
MQDSDKSEFMAMLEGIFLSYGKDINISVYRIWWGAVRQFSIEEIDKAFNAHVMNPESGQYLPKPADIIKHLKGTNTDRAAIAWSRVIRAIEIIGPYQTIAFDDPVIHAVIRDMDGWVKLNSITDAESPFVANDFKNRYRAYLTTGLLEYPGKMLGISDGENMRNGYKTSDPVLIGNAEKAFYVLENGGEDQKNKLTRFSDIKKKLELEMRVNHPAKLGKIKVAG